METIVATIAAVVVLACLMLCGSRCLGQTPGDRPARPAGPPSATSSDQISSLDRSQVRALLKKLADTPGPKELAMGACCYKPASRPRRAEYVCPKCGERSLYDEAKMAERDWLDHGVAPVVDREVPTCRREIQELRKIVGDAIALDESQFCRKCSPKVTTPKLVLHISYKGEKPRDVEGVKHDDLRMLRELLSGKLRAKADNDSETPLKDKLPRLQELLGEKLDK